MRKPVNSNFERMRLEDERRRLADLEAEAASLAERLESQGSDSRQEIDALRAENADLRRRLREEREDEGRRHAELQQRHDALAERLVHVDRSFSEPERLRKAIVPVLPGAIRDAGEDDRDYMVSAIAPSVIGTIRTEILNSEDELVEAIHPRLGSLISAAIANAIEELNRKVDEALPIDRWMASIKGRLTGAPPAGWLLESGDEFVVRDAMLIERKSGILLASERLSGENDDALDEDLMAGMIAALQGFASDAYGATGAGDLRRFSFTEDTVYLRGTPTKILALRCSGVAPPEIERQVDELLVAALERLRGPEAEHGDVLGLDGLVPTLEPEAETGVSASGIVGRGLAVIAATVALVWGNAAVTGAHQARWTDAVEGAVADPLLAPWPLAVEPRGDGEGAILVSGLLPDRAALLALESRIDRTAVPVPVAYDIVLIEAGPR